ncbi:MAG: mono/diheme cytochrome c family protein [Cryomorphaceae bacterium]|jgi:mono/diheme cytochrome c family protein
MKFLKYISIALAFVALIFAFFSESIAFDVSSPWQQVVGNIHPILLHLPIGGLCIVILLQISRKCGWVEADDKLIYFLLLFTSLVACASFFTGFALSLQGGYNSELLSDHLWSAAFYVCFLTLCAFLKDLKSNNNSSPLFFNISIIGALVSMTFTGHYGGLMSHGDPLAPFFAKAEGEHSFDSDKPTEELLVFNEVVHPILKGKCYSCHGNDKAKGKLSLNTYDEIIKGGKAAGETLIPGDHKKSLLISSLMLPLDDEKHMPPKKKTQLTSGEIEILKWWVATGAKRDVTVAEVQPPSEIITAITELVPEEIRQQREMDRLQKIARQKEKAKQQRLVLRQEIEKTVPVKLRPMLRFISPHDASIHFSSVSLQEQFGDSEFATLTGLAKYFTSVDLSHSSISTPTLEALSSCLSLHSLRLADTKISVEDVALLKSLPALETLSLHSTEIDATALKHLSEISSLRHLYLWSTNVTSADIETFKKNHPQINVVN